MFIRQWSKKPSIWSRFRSCSRWLKSLFAVIFLVRKTKNSAWLCGIRSYYRKRE